MGLKTFRRFALASTIATYMLIFLGGLVRVSGAGLGCPDWPQCFGRWIPPINVSQVPPEFDPSQFNITLAWIEYINRFCGVVVGILIAVTAVLAIKSARHVPRLLYPSIAAALLVAVAGWQGRAVILTELQPIVVSVHMLLAVLIVSLLLWVTFHAYREGDSGSPERVGVPPKYRRWLAVLWVAGMLQIVLGTQMRQALEEVVQVSPLLHSTQWVARTGVLGHVHLAVGALVVIATWYLGIGLLGRKQSLPSTLRSCLWVVMVLAGSQILIGVGFVLWGVPPLLQVFHMWLASLFIGGVLVVYAAARSNPRAAANGRRA